MEPAFFRKREDRLFWTAYFRKQLDLLAQACAVWITQHMEDGHVYNAHPHQWEDNGRDVRCWFQIDTDRYSSMGVNFIFRLTGYVTPDNLDASFKLSTDVHIDGQDQQKFQVETDNPFAYFRPEVLFSWATQDNAGLSERASPAMGGKTVDEASVQDLLDALRMKLGNWRRFDERQRRRPRG